MQETMEADILAGALAMYPVFLQALPYNIGITIVDREKYLVYHPAENLDLKLPVGEPIKPGSLVDQAMRQKGRIFTKVDKSARGLPFIGCAYPLIDKKGEVAGAFAVSVPVEKYEETRELAEQLNSQVKSIAGTCETVSAQSEEIGAISRLLLQTARESQQQAKDSEQILTLLKGIVSQTNLLGLNASIEAARAGTSGRGFQVVAEEIRKLATNGTDSIKNITDIIHSIQNSSSNITGEVSSVEQAVANIAGAMTDLAAITQQVSVLSERLDSMANDLCKRV